MTLSLVFLIVVAIFFWLANFKVIVFSRDWPVLIIIFGVFVFLKTCTRNNRKRIIDRLSHGKINAAEAEKLLRKE